MTSTEITFFALLSVFGALTMLLCFMVYINNFRVLSLMFALPLLIISSIILANAVSLVGDPNPEIKATYSVDRGVAMPLMYSAMSVSIIACALTGYYYGRHFISNIRNFV
jgi:hypothetical protein